MLSSRTVGFDVSQATVAKYMTRRATPPSQTWRTFLANHLRQIAAADFFVVPTATCRLSFVLVLCPSRFDAGSRRVERVALYTFRGRQRCSQRVRRLARYPITALMEPVLSISRESSRRRSVVASRSRDDSAPVAWIVR